MIIQIILAYSHETDYELYFQLVQPIVMNIHRYTDSSFQLQLTVFVCWTVLAYYIFL